jgi:hypothetical protein
MKRGPTEEEGTPRMEREPTDGEGTYGWGGESRVHAIGWMEGEAGPEATDQHGIMIHGQS